MNAKKLALGLLTAMVVISPLAAFKPASARTITTAYPEANLIASIFVEPSLLTETIKSAVETAENRSGFVVRAMTAARFAAAKEGDGDFNVLVFNLEQDHHDEITEGAEYFYEFDYAGVPFGVWIFRKGKFVNKGDHGFDNWAFHGQFKTEKNGDDTTVIFH